MTGTKSAQLKEFTFGEDGLIHIIDMPGLGESIEDDHEYARIYQRELLGADAALYVLQADERILGEDQRILREIVAPAMAASGRKAGDRIVVGLNKVDLLQPGEWDPRLNYPTPEQEKTIERRCSDIVEKLGRLISGLDTSKIVYYSAEKRYRLNDLLLPIVESAGRRGWQLSVTPKSPWDLAAPDVQKHMRRLDAEDRH